MYTYLQYLPTDVGCVYVFSANNVVVVAVIGGLNLYAFNRKHTHTAEIASVRGRRHSMISVRASFFVCDERLAAPENVFPLFL